MTGPVDTRRVQATLGTVSVGTAANRAPRNFTVPQRAGRLLRAALTDPVEVALYLPDRWSRRHDRETEYPLEPDWEARLHEWLGADWPCPCTTEATVLWQAVVTELAELGRSVGRFTYADYSDGDEGLARAAWYAVRHTRPDIVVETGVARGLTSRTILEALERTGSGRLWSVDLPHPFEPAVRDETALAVPDDRRGRWQYVRGSSRRRLPTLLRHLGSVDVFLHDSLHTARNLRFEMAHVARVLAPRGLMIVDDIEMQSAFASFAADHPEFRVLACRAADRKGVFGIAMRRP